MPERAFLREVENQFIADMYIGDLEAAGFRAITIQPSFPYPTATTSVQIWLVDGAELEKPGAQLILDDIFSPAKLETELEADEPIEIKRHWFRWWHGVVGFVVLMAVWVLLFGQPSHPSFRFMKSAVSGPKNPVFQRWCSSYGFEGDYLQGTTPFKETLDAARQDLLPRGFREEGAFDEHWFYREVNEGRMTVEVIGVFPAFKYDSKAGRWKDDLSRSIFSWAYKPSVAQMIWRMVGL